MAAGGAAAQCAAWGGLPGCAEQAASMQQKDQIQELVRILDETCGADTIRGSPYGLKIHICSKQGNFP
jgi:hypothetical protein